MSYYLLHAREIRQLVFLKAIHTLLRHAQVQGIRLFQLLKLRQSRQHVLDGTQTGRILGLSEVGVILDEFLEIGHEFLNAVLHVTMSVFHPDLVLFGDLDVLFVLVGLTFVDEGLVADSIAIVDGKEVVRHGLVGEFVEDGSEQVHGSIDNVQRASRA